MRPLFTPKLLQHAAQLFQTSSRNEYMYGIDQLPLDLTSESNVYDLAYLLSVLCSDSISDKYLEYSIRAIHQNPDIMDMMILMDMPLENITDVIMDLSIHVTGFVITHKGECPLLPDTHAIQLICSPYNKGSLLMCVFLTAIVRNTTELNKKAILELADGPLNIAGLCMYTKFGFRYDPTLFQTRCFTNIKSLPMTCDIQKEYTIESAPAVELQLKYILFGETGSFHLPQKDPLCAIRDMRLQLLLAMIDVVINSITHSIHIRGKSNTMIHPLGLIRYKPILKWVRVNGVENLKTIREFPALHSPHIQALLKHTQADAMSDFPKTFTPRPFLKEPATPYRAPLSVRNSTVYKTHKIPKPYKSRSVR
jgi:hypothetical protein